VFEFGGLSPSRGPAASETLASRLTEARPKFQGESKPGPDRDRGRLELYAPSG